MLWPCLQLTPAARGRIAVHAPDAHCWYDLPSQLNIPSEVHGPDSPPVLELEPELELEAEPVATAEAAADFGAELAAGFAEVAMTLVTKPVGDEVLLVNAAAELESGAPVAVKGKTDRAPAALDGA